MDLQFYKLQILDFFLIFLFSLQWFFPGKGFLHVIVFTCVLAKQSTHSNNNFLKNENKAKANAKKKNLNKELPNTLLNQSLFQ